MSTVAPEVLLPLAKRWQLAPRAQRRQVVQESAGLLGLSESRVYSLFQASLQVGGRARRRRGSKVTDEQVRVVARVLAQCINKRGKVQTSVEDAIEMATLGGLLPASFDASTSTVRRRLRELLLDTRSLEASDPSITRRSTHPNHVHVVDFSPSMQWYLKGDGSLGVHKELQYKPEQIRKQKAHLWRYLLVDHCTGVFFVRYYLAAGEGSMDLVDFLQRAWTPREDRRFPFCGVPDLVLADQGAPFKAKATRNLLRSLNVEVELHAAGNAKASGSVERGHGIWQRRFDARLALCPATNLAELNETAFEHAVSFNANEPHRRLGRPRMPAWCEIKAGQLRLPPERVAFLRLATRDPVERTVRNNLQIRHSNLSFELEGAVVPGEKVLVYESPCSDPPLQVWTARGDQLAVTELQADEWGFQTGGRQHVLGSGEYSSHKASPAQLLKAELKREPLQIPEAFGARIAENDVLFLAPRHGVPAMAPEELPTAPPLSLLDVKERAVAVLGRGLSREESRSITAAASGGVSHDQVEELLARLFPNSEGVRTA